MAHHTLPAATRSATASASSLVATAQKQRMSMDLRAARAHVVCGVFMVAIFIFLTRAETVRDSNTTCGVMR